MKKTINFIFSVNHVLLTASLAYALVWLLSLSPFITWYPPTSLLFIPWLYLLSELSIVIILRRALFNTYKKKAPCDWFWIDPLQHAWLKVRQTEYRYKGAMLSKLIGISALSLFFVSRPLFINALTSVKGTNMRLAVFFILIIFSALILIIKYLVRTDMNFWPTRWYEAPN